jgi:hypothetical protein
MEPEILLLCSQELDTGPYPEPDESSPQPPHPIDILIISFRVVSSFQVFQRTCCRHFSYPHACYMPSESHAAWFEHPTI